MVAYVDLSDSDKAVVQNAVNLMRAGAGEVARTFNHWRAIAEDTNAIGLFNSIDNGQTVPNTSGLAGADDMTKDEIAALFLLLDTMRTGTDDATFRAAASKAAGINALLG